MSVVIGSHAAKFRGVQVGRKAPDIDVIGTSEDMSEFRRRNAGDIVSEEEIVAGTRVHFHLRPGIGADRVEFQVACEESDRILLGLATDASMPVLASQAFVPSPNVLYLTKRSHLNFPKDWEKHFRDMLQLIPHVSPFSDPEVKYYRSRKAETHARYERVGPKFTLKTSNEEFFRVSDHIRTYVHDDLHKAIAFEPGRPLYERCKTDLATAYLDRKLFEALPVEQQIRLPQEEFIVIGIERFYLHNRNLPATAVYSGGLMKTVRDLCRGWFQDFCLDNMRMLAAPPDHDFIAKFERAERNGELRRVKKKANTDLYSKILARAQELRKAGFFDQARQQCDDVLKNDRDNPDALYELGMIMKAAGHPQEAERLFRQALKTGAADWIKWNTLGMLLLGQGRADEAIACFRSALGRHGNSAPLWFNFGCALESRARIGEAVDCYRRALRLQPGQPTIKARLERALQAHAHGAASSGAGAAAADRHASP